MSRKTNSSDAECIGRGKDDNRERRGRINSGYVECMAEDK